MITHQQQEFALSTEKMMDRVFSDFHCHSLYVEQTKHESSKNTPLTAG